MSVCVLVYALTHTQTIWVLDVSPVVGRTPGGPEESRWTKVRYTCRPYRCTKYICLHKCRAAGFDDLAWLPFSFQHLSSFEKSRRCDYNQQTSVTHFDENKRLHLESSKQNYYIVSLWAIIKAIFSHRTILRDLSSSIYALSPIKFSLSMFKYVDLLSLYGKTCADRGEGNFRRLVQQFSHDRRHVVHWCI